MRRTILASLTAALLLAGLVPAAVSAYAPPGNTVSFVSGDSWTAYTDAGLTNSLGNAAVVCVSASGCTGDEINYGTNYSSAWSASLASIPGAEWIWRPDITASSPTPTTATAYFSQTFDLAFPVASDATMYIAADNDAEVFVNGTSVGVVGVMAANSAPQTSFNTIHEITLPAADFVVGPNVITVEGLNATQGYGQTYAAGNPAGVVFGATLQLTGYEPDGTTCDGTPGHQILPPIKTDGSSIFKQGSTVPAKFVVCDASGNLVGTPGVVTGFAMVKVIVGNETGDITDVVSTTPDTAFRWTGSLWIYNISTSNLKAGYTYFYEITLNDKSTIDFSFSLK